jgi:hypothetical protein
MNACGDGVAAAELSTIVGKQQRKIERLERELACYRERLPGHWYSRRHDMLACAVEPDDAVE